MISSLHSSLVALALVASLSGCDALANLSEKKADAAESEGTPGVDVWQSADGRTAKLSRLELTLIPQTKGISLMVPVGTKESKSLMENYSDLSDEADLDFDVSVRKVGDGEFASFKEMETVVNEDGKFLEQDADSYVFAFPFAKGQAYRYLGLFEANGKLFVCSTQTLRFPQERLNADQVQKVCESMQFEGKPMRPAAAPATPSDSASASSSASPSAAPSLSASPSSLPSNAASTEAATAEQPAPNQAPAKVATNAAPIPEQSPAPVPPPTKTADATPPNTAKAQPQTPASPTQPRPRLNKPTKAKKK